MRDRQDIAAGSIDIGLMVGHFSFLNVGLNGFDEFLLRGHSQWIVLEYPQLITIDLKAIQELLDIPAVSLLGVQQRPNPLPHLPVPHPLHQLLQQSGVYLVVVVLRVLDGVYLPHVPLEVHHLQGHYSHRKQVRGVLVEAYQAIVVFPQFLGRREAANALPVAQTLPAFPLH